MSEFLKNTDTNTEIFYHGSRDGLKGNIRPVSRANCDFGVGFYIGTKYAQAVDIASSLSGQNPSVYELKIPGNIFTKKNTLFLTKRDWLYYTLYNREKLEKIKDTPLYNYYSALDKDKQFIIGAIVDDSYKNCLEMYLRNGLTDKGYFEIIDSFNYGIQIVAKTQEACDKLLIVKDKIHRLNYDEIGKARRLSQQKSIEGYGKFIELYDKYEYMEGTTFKELCSMAKNGYLPKSSLKKDKLMCYDNIRFPKIMHTKGDNEYEPFG